MLNVKVWIWLYITNRLTHNSHKERIVSCFRREVILFESLFMLKDKLMKNSFSLFESYVALAALTVGSVVSLSYSAHAAEVKPCYQQFSEAKKAGTLTEKTFKEYKAAHCDKVVQTSEQPAANDAKKAEQPVAKSAKENEPSKETPKKEVVEKSPVTTGEVVFPEKIDPKFANEKEGKARMMTCQEQYKANKASGKNGGLKWIQKGGGYYSECNKNLKSTTTK